MKAVFIREHGGLEALTYGELPDPDVGINEVLVRVRACALNRRDIFVREGSHGMRPRFPAVLGLDFAGDVAAVGPGVMGLSVGDRVMGVTGQGSYAEYTVTSPVSVQRIPDGVTYEEAAAVPTVFTTAWRMLVHRASVRPGEDVLVMAAGSGVGSAALQVARLLGARVLVTAGTDEKLAKAAELGAAAGINHRTEDVAARVQELTDGAGVDVVAEHIGTPVWDVCFRSLKPGGRLVTCGVSAGHLVTLHLGRLWTRELSVLGAHMQPQTDLGVVARLLGQRRLRGVVHAVLPLEEAARAHQMMEAGEFFGKIVLRVP